MNSDYRKFAGPTVGALENTGYLPDPAENLNAQHFLFHLRPSNVGNRNLDFMAGSSFQELLVGKGMKPYLEELE